MLARILKSGFLLLLVFALVWLAVVVWWQESGRAPTGTDMALYLVLLPLLLLGALIWLRSRWLAARERKQALAQQQAEAAAPPADTAPAARGMPLLAVHAISASGRDCADIVKTLRSQPRAELDPALTHGRGFPTFAARLASLDTDQQRDALPDELAELGRHDEMLRAGALLGQTLQALLEQARERLAVPAADGVTPDWPTLPVQCLLPADWPAPLREAVMQHAMAIAAQRWPAAALRSEIVPVSDAEHALAALVTLARAHEESDAATPMPWRILAACDSAIGQSVVTRWAHRQRLMTAENRQGRVPGEAAAGLLLGAAGAQAAPLLLMPPERASRTLAADQDKQGKDDTLASLLQRMLEQSGLQTGQLGALISDADHRGVRPLESAALAQTLALDADETALSTGEGCGDTGVAAPLLSIALAAELALQTGKPTIAAAVQDDLLRSASLLKPGTFITAT